MTAHYMLTPELRFLLKKILRAHDRLSPHRVSWCGWALIIGLLLLMSNLIIHKRPTNPPACYKSSIRAGFRRSKAIQPATPIQWDKRFLIYIVFLGRLLWRKQSSSSKSPLPRQNIKMIPKTFLLAFLSLQSSNGPQTSGEGNSEVAIQIDVLEPAIALQGAEYGPEKAVNRIDYLSTPRVQTGGNADDDAQVPLKISSGQGEVVIQRGYKEFNVTCPSPPFPLLSLKHLD